MNGASGLQADCGKPRRARIRGRRLKAEGQKLRTQNFRPRTSQHAHRFLHEQRRRFGTRPWHLLHTYDLITLSTDISKREERFQMFLRFLISSHKWMLVDTPQNEIPEIARVCR